MDFLLKHINNKRLKYIYYHKNDLQMLSVMDKTESLVKYLTDTMCYNTLVKLCPGDSMVHLSWFKLNKNLHLYIFNDNIDGYCYTLNLYPDDVGEYMKSLNSNSKDEIINNIYKILG